MTSAHGLTQFTNSRSSNLFPVAKIGNVRNRLHQFGRLHDAGRRRHHRLPGRRDGAARGLVPVAACNRSPSFPTNSSRNTIRSTAGTEGMKFFPFVFSLFMFVLTLNLIGLIPYTFTVTSHIIITAALALHGVPHRADLRLLAERAALLQPVRAEGRADLHPAADRRIEILSFLSRPISHSVRLFANMLAGHITLKVFASFIILLGGGLGADRLARRHIAARDDRRSYGAGDCWSRSCRPTSSPSSLASTSTMRFTRATKARPEN